MSKKKKGMSILSICMTASIVLLPLQYVQAEEIEDKIVINEIESNDPVTDIDWVEIINTGESDVDISGWFITDNKDLERLEKKEEWRIADGTILKAGEVYVIEHSEVLDNLSLGKEDTVALYDSSNKLLDTFSYTGHAAGTYSRVPDGTGEFVDQASTKGALNIVEEEEKPKFNLLINEVNSSPDDWVEFINLGTEEMDISGYEIRDNSDDHRWKFPEGTKIQSGALLVVDAKENGKVYDDQTDTYATGTFETAIGIGSGDSIRLYDNDGNLLDECSWTEHASYDGDAARASIGRYPDGTGAFGLVKETKGTQNDWYKPEIVINEVESNGDETDWVEVYNAGTTAVDISGWYLYDDDPVGHSADITPVEEGTILNPGEFYVFDGNKDFTFGLGKADKAVIYNKDGVVIAEYSWSTHADGVYARIPDGTGEFVDFGTSTKGEANNKDNNTSEDTPGSSEDTKESVTWPGNSEVKIYDVEPTFLEDSSGLDFFQGQLYAVDNGTGKFWVLDVDKDGNLSFAEGFENGKRIRFQKDANDPTAAGPDSEGITVDGNGLVYIASERDNSAKGVNFNMILMVDPSVDSEDLVALKQWDLTVSLPQVSANMGIEAVEWVSNEDVVGKLYDQNTNSTFDAANYPNATADGVFFVALEDNGHVYAYVLNEDGTSVQIADIDAKIGGAMALDYDTYENVLWVVADNGYDNLAAKVTLTGNATPEIVHVQAPAGVDITANNEGFAIADASYTVDGQRPVYRFKDGEKSGALSIGSITCDYVEGTDNDNSENINDNHSGAANGNTSVTTDKSGAVESPKTGDNNAVMFWGVILAVSALFAACFGKRKYLIEE